MADLIFFIMVAGLEYSHKGLGFTQMCSERTEELLSQIRRGVGSTDALVQPPAQLRFLRFDFGSGVVSSIDYALAQKGNREITINDRSWKPVPVNDPNNSFITKSWPAISPKSAFYFVDATHTDVEYFHQELPNAKPIMSIVDVYEAIRNMPRGTLAELSIMSHGSDKGPILVNSFDKTGIAGRRDPTDKDGRSLVDFQPDMGQSSHDGDLAKFVGAFRNRSSFRMWGCNATQVPAVVIYQTYQARIRAGSRDPLKAKLLKTPPQIRNDQKFDFVFENKKPGQDDAENFIDIYFDEDPHFLTLDRTKDPSLTITRDAAGNIARVTCLRTFEQIRGLIARYMEDSYALAAAEKGGSAGGTFDCFGALPGTSAEAERKGHELLHVDENTYGARLDFYRRFLGVEIDKKRGRGYGHMTADLATNVHEWAKVNAF